MAVWWHPAPPESPSGQASQKPGKSASAASTPLLSVPRVKSRGDSRLPHAPSPGGGPGNSAYHSPLLRFANPAGCGSELPARAGLQLKVPTQGSSRCWCQSPLPLPFPPTPDSHPDPIPRPPEEPWEPRGLLVQPPCASAALAFRGLRLEGTAGREQPAREESGAVPVSRGPSASPRGSTLHSLPANPPSSPEMLTARRSPSRGDPLPSVPRTTSLPRTRPTPRTTGRPSPALLHLCSCPQKPKTEPSEPPPAPASQVPGCWPSPPSAMVPVWGTGWSCSGSCSGWSAGDNSDPRGAMGTRDTESRARAWVWTWPLPVFPKQPLACPGAPLCDPGRWASSPGCPVRLQGLSASSPPFW